MRPMKLLLTLLLASLVACQYLPFGKKEATTIFIGEPETIIVEPPEDAFDVGYTWSITGKPNESVLMPDFSSTNIFTFTADEVGDYAFAVTVTSGGEEVADYDFYFTAYEDTSVMPPERVTAEVPARVKAKTPPPAAPVAASPPKVKAAAQPAKPSRAAKKAPARRRRYCRHRRSERGAERRGRGEQR